MIKPIDMSVLPDGFLIEARVFKQGINNNYSTWQLEFKDSNDPVISNRSRAYRPALNFWHHNDGTMTLPIGLVCEFRSNLGSRFVDLICTQKFALYEPEDTDSIEHIIAVKIIGVTAKYGPQLGMEVIDV